MLTLKDPQQIEKYLTDESHAFKGHATAVHLPESEPEIKALFQDCYVRKERMTVSGAGTSITGSRVPMGGFVVSTERLRHVETPHLISLENSDYQPISIQGYSLYLNRTARRALVPPAIPLQILDEALSPFGLCYPPDPTERSASLGGTVATNASGACSYFYGPTRAWIGGLRVVLPQGDGITLTTESPTADDAFLDLTSDVRRYRLPIPDPKNYLIPNIKHAAGLYLKSAMRPLDLFVGSEGILGLISEIELALSYRPQDTLTVVAFFKSHEELLAFTDHLICQKKLYSVMSIEYFDHRALDFMRPKHPQIPSGSAGAVLVEMMTAHPDKNSAQLLEHAARFDSQLAQYSLIDTWAVESDKREQLRTFRHSLPELVNSYAHSKLGKIGTDMAVPHGHFHEMRRLYETVCTQTKVPFVIFGHIGNDHLHINFFPESETEAKCVWQAYGILARAAVNFGGTISAEHGVGKKTVASDKKDMGRQPYLAFQYPQKGLDAIRAVKKQLDPLMLFNVGNMIV